jgi:hypothetical protein
MITRIRNRAMILGAAMVLRDETDESPLIAGHE